MNKKTSLMISILSLLTLAIVISGLVMRSNQKTKASLGRSQTLSYMVALTANSREAAKRIECFKDKCTTKEQIEGSYQRLIDIAVGAETSPDTTPELKSVVLKYKNSLIEQKKMLQAKGPTKDLQQALTSATLDLRSDIYKDLKKSN